MEDELWMRKIKERLDDYSEPLPVSGWERLEKDLSVSKPPVAGKRRIIPFRRWAVAAAAALLVAVSSVSVWLLQSPVGEEMRNMTAPALAAVPDKLPEQQTPSVRTEITEPDYRAQKQESPADTNRRSLLAQQLNTVDETERETVIQSLGTEPEVQTGNAQEPTAESAQVNQEAAEEERKLMQEEEAFVTKFEEAMDDDFNTADALAAVFELVKFANTNVQEGSSAEFAAYTLEVMTKLCDVLGLTLEKKEEILDEEIENLIAERQNARKAKDFARADEIRGLLLEKGIELKDTREGVKWKRI